MATPFERRALAMDAVTSRATASLVSGIDVDAHADVNHKGLVFSSQSALLEHLRGRSLPEACRALAPLLPGFNMSAIPSKKDLVGLVFALRSQKELYKTLCQEEPIPSFQEFLERVSILAPSCTWYVNRTGNMRDACGEIIRYVRANSS